MNIPAEALYWSILPTIGLAFILPILLAALINDRKLRIFIAVAIPFFIFHASYIVDRRMDIFDAAILLVGTPLFEILPFVLLGEGVVFLWRKVRRKG